MRDSSKTADAALIAFSEHMGLSLIEWQRNVIHGLYDGGSSSPYTIASAPFCPANTLGHIANNRMTRAYAQVSRGIPRNAEHHRSPGSVLPGTPWGGTPTCVDGSPKGP